MNLGLALFVLANLVITAGYVFVAVRIVPVATVRLRRTRVGGVVFFTTCGLTHLEMALHGLTGEPMDLASWHSLAIHLPQAVAVWMFVTGLYLEFVRWGPWPLQKITPSDLVKGEGE